MSEMNIKNPSCVKNVSDIKVESTQTADVIKATYTYPNGFEMYIEQYADEIKVSSNKPFIKVDDNTYQIPK